MHKNCNLIFIVLSSLSTGQIRFVLFWTAASVWYVEQCTVFFAHPVVSNFCKFSGSSVTVMQRAGQLLQYIIQYNKQYNITHAATLHLTMFRWWVVETN